MAVAQDLTHRADPVLEPHVRGAVERIPGQRFSTKRLIDELRSTPEGEAAYQEALGLCSEGGGSEHTARLIVHGQTIPLLLRRSGQVRFAGYIHGQPDEDDGYGVPSWWRKV